MPSLLTLEESNLIAEAGGLLKIEVRCREVHLGGEFRKDVGDVLGEDVHPYRRLLRAVLGLGAERVRPDGFLDALRRDAVLRVECFLDFPAALGLL